MGEKIPKIIHYCWFGDKPLSDMAKKCIESWKKYCPEYEIIQWNEKNFSVDYNMYVKEAYEAKKWAFVSDVARLVALTENGGIYMDTDVELIKPIDELLEYEAFSGFEAGTKISTAMLGCIKGQSLFLEFLKDYAQRHFVKNDGSLDLETNVSRLTSICSRYGFIPNNQEQVLNGMRLFPSDYFCPKDSNTQSINITDNTYCIHHFDASWYSEEDRYVKRLTKRIKIPGGGYIATFLGAAKYRGIMTAMKETASWLKGK